MKKILLILLLISTHAFALDGIVTNVHDGDSITVSGLTKKVRIRYIDAPEFKAFKWGNQPYAQDSKSNLQSLCYGKVASLSNMRIDKYQRVIANVSCQGFDVAKWQIDTGSAWGYHYAPKRFKVMALNAKSKNIGLWALPNPIDPWAWRKNGLH